MNWLERLKNDKGSDNYPAEPAIPSSAGFAGSDPGLFVNTKAEMERSAGFAGSISGHIENSMMAAVVVVPVPDWAADPANDAAVGLTVARVATVAVASPSDSKAAPAGTIDTVPTTAPDPDRWCWPHSDAMSSAEIDRFTGRLALFTAKGLTANDAEVLADKLLIRDRAGEDRRVCLECSHLSGWAGRRQCRGLQYAGMGGPLASAGQVALLQRCGGFKAAASSESNKRTSP